MFTNPSQVGVQNLLHKLGLLQFSTVSNNFIIFLFGEFKYLYHDDIDFITHDLAAFTGSSVNIASVISPPANESSIVSDNHFIFFLASTKALFETSSSILVRLPYNFFRFT
jgi:hypothetical protein